MHACVCVHLSVCVCVWPRKAKWCKWNRLKERKAIQTYPNKWVKCWAILMLSLTAINQNPPTASVVMYDCVLIATYTVKYCEEANKFTHYNSLVQTESYKRTWAIKILAALCIGHILRQMQLKSKQINPPSRYLLTLCNSNTVWLTLCCCHGANIAGGVNKRNGGFWLANFSVTASELWYTDHANLKE